MATIKREVEPDRRNRVVLTVLVACAVMGSVAYFLANRPPPQLGASDEVYKSVDALYTAVRNEDETQLNACEQRLLALKGAGTLSNHAWDYLKNVIGKARAGKWRPAAELLYDFMKGQRRE